jgi:hypothetical protein
LDANTVVFCRFLASLIADIVVFTMTRARRASKIVIKI